MRFVCSPVVRFLPAWFLLGLTGASPAASTHKGQKAEPAAAVQSRMALPFLHDDYAGARARAQRESKVLIVETWAGWCHTCLSMQSFVFTDPLLRPMADRFIYVSLDTDRPGNGAFLKRFPITIWPTMLAIDPGQSSTASDERVLARWTGAMTAPEFNQRLGKLLERADRADVEEADRLLQQADAAAAEARWDVAKRLYAEAAKVSVVERPRALLGVIQALYLRGEFSACAELLSTSLPSTGSGSAATDFAVFAEECLDRIEDADRRQRLRSKLRDHLVSLAEDPKASLSVDDRSDAYGTLIRLADSLGDMPQGDRFAEARLRMLEEAASAARTPADAATFDQHRLESYRRLKRYEPAEKMLLQSSRALAGDCNPPYRLAKLYYEMGRLEEAQSAIESAVAKAYGLRKATMLELQASIRASQGQRREAVQALGAAIQLLEAQPYRNEQKLAELRRLVASHQSVLQAQGRPPRSSLRLPGPTVTPVAMRPRD